MDNVNETIIETNSRSEEALHRKNVIAMAASLLVLHLWHFVSCSPAHLENRLPMRSVKSDPLLAAVLMSIGDRHSREISVYRRFRLRHFRAEEVVDWVRKY